MDKWIERFSSKLAERTSRRGMIGWAGRSLVAIGAATVGIAKLAPVYAQTDCSGCAGGGCQDWYGMGCLDTAYYAGGCTGTVYDGCVCQNTPGLHDGWAWFCCPNGSGTTRYKCQDCCDSSNGYHFTCRQAWDVCS